MLLNVFTKKKPEKRVKSTMAKFADDTVILNGYDEKRKGI